MNDGKYQKALDRSKKVLTRTEQYNDEQVNDRQRLISNLHSYAGNAQLELGKYKLALEHHKRDHEISTKEYASINILFISLTFIYLIYFIYIYISYI